MYSGNRAAQIGEESVYAFLFQTGGDFRFQHISEIVRIAGMKDVPAFLYILWTRKRTRDLNGSDIKVIREESEVYQKSVGTAVDMRGHGHTTVGADLFCGRGQAQVGSTDEQAVFFCDGLVVFVYNELVAEIGRLVPASRPVPVMT